MATLVPMHRHGARGAGPTPRSARAPVRGHTLLGCLLAATAAVVAACAGGDEVATPSGDREHDVVDTALVSSGDTVTVDQDGQRADDPTPPADPAAAFRVLVTSPEGVSSPGLDAVVSVLAARPSTHVEVIAPAADVSDSAGDRSSTELAPVRAETMTGHRAFAINGGILDALDVAGDPAAPAFDLAIVGAATDSDAVDLAARTLTDQGLAVLVIAVDDDPDLAAAGLLLSDVLDYHLDEVVAEAGIHVLTVPSCTSGVVRGPVPVDPSARPLPPPDCASTAAGPFTDEADAVANGFAALAAHDGMA